MRIGELFAGYGGLGMGVTSVLGGDVAWVSEIDPGACKILAHRFPGVPNHGDITTVDWSAVEPVDVLTGGFPCQDVSAAGKRLGIRPGTRSGLWAQFAYAIDQLRPPLVVIENVRGLLSAAAEHPAHGDLEPCPWCVGDDEPVTLRALGAVLGELADLGYDASWQGLRAADVGAPHGRFRVFVTAWPAADTQGRSLSDQPRSDDPGRAVVGSRSRAGHRDGTGSAPTGVPVLGRGAGLAGPTDADAAHDGRERSRRAWDGRPGSADGGRGATAHTESHGRHERRTEPARLIGGPDAAVSGHAVAAHADRDGLEGFGGLVSLGRDADRCRGADIAWGDYEPAIRRWERVLSRPAPAPTEPNAKGSQRLSARFVEWMQGLPAGWVTDVPGLSRNDQLKALGNGVVPQQAAAALRLLLPDVIGAAA